MFKAIVFRVILFLFIKGVNCDFIKLSIMPPLKREGKRRIE